MLIPLDVWVLVFKQQALRVPIANSGQDHILLQEDGWCRTSYVIGKKL